MGGPIFSTDRGVVGEATTRNNPGPAASGVDPAGSEQQAHGFRPGRSAHQALETGWKRLMDMGGGWVLEVDIRKFFDTLDHRHLRDILDRRVRDGVIRRLIGKWLKAGVMESGSHIRPEAGTPQGGVISPLLANIKL